LYCKQLVFSQFCQKQILWIFLIWLVTLQYIKFK
jgi:hypothetical protein